MNEIPSYLVDELKGHVAKKIGAIARPDEILFAAELPKTRSGKIMPGLTLLGNPAACRGHKTDGVSPVVDIT